MLTRGQPQLGMRVLGESGTGKSSAAKAVIRQFEAKRPRTREYVPIVLVTLEAGTTSKKLMMKILEFFGDPYSVHRNEQVLKNRVKACFERFGTVLLIIDEVQHLDNRMFGKDDTTDSLKRLLDDGVVPIVFMGTEAAKGLFTRDIQLASRLVPPYDFKQLDLRTEGDRSLIAGYVALLDRALVEKRILSKLSGLDDPQTLLHLHAVAKGYVGRISRVVRIALEYALERGAWGIDNHDLALAVDRWAIPHGLTNENPFLARGRR